MENNSQPPAPAAPAKVTPPANEPPKTKQVSSNQEVVPMAAGTAATDGSAAQPQRGTAVGSVPLRSSVQQHPQPSSLLQVQRPLVQGSSSNKAVVATAGTGFMPWSPTAVGSLARRPVQQTNPVVFRQGSSSSNQAMQGSSTTQAAVAATALVAPMHGPTAKRGAPVPWLPPTPRVVRPRKLPVISPPAPPPPKLPVYRPPPPPRPELVGSSAAGNALLPSSSNTGFCSVSNMQADPPTPAQVTTAAEKGSDSDGGSGSRDHVEMLDLNFPPVSDDKEN